MSRQRPHRSLLLALLLSVGACASSGFDRARVADEVEARGSSSGSVGPAPRHDPAIPDGVDLLDGLSADEAVILALWNNPSFHADLAQLSFARADLAEAGALPNPMLTLLFPLGPHQLSSYLLMPLAALAQRPARVQAARRDVERVAHSLVQSGLDLIRDVRVAHFEAVAQEERVQARGELLRLWTASEALAKSRTEAGDISRGELDALRGETLLAADQAARAEQDATAARLRLRVLLGVTDAQLPPTIVLTQPPEPTVEVDTATLIRDALAARPDLRAAELAVEAAGKRLGLERARIFQALLRVDGQLDAQGFRPSLGIHQIELPILNWNPGGRGRAKAELEQALWRYVVVQQRIIAEVETAELQARQAHDSLDRWRGGLFEALESSLAAATERYRGGEDSYVVVLDATRRLQDARLREIDLRLDLARAGALLDRSVGHHHDHAPPPVGDRAGHAQS